MTLEMSQLKSGRYKLTDSFDRFSGTYIFVCEARKYNSVLECGCSSGFISRLISSNGGPKVIGIEIDEEAAERAREVCKLVISSDLNSKGWSNRIDQKFDLITFGDVLEHLIDPLATLREAQCLLNPGGRILISLPNVAHWSIRAKLLLGRFEYKPTGLMDYTHLRFFTTITGTRLIEDAGYTILFRHPVLGGRFTAHFRPAWQRITNTFPNLFAVQMLFLAEPKR